MVSLLQTTQIKQGASFIAANKVYASTNKITIVESRRNSFFFFFFFTRGGCVSYLRECFDAKLLLLSYQYPNLSEGADSVGRQLRGDKDQCPFSGVTKSGRVWRKVPESGARSVAMDPPPPPPPPHPATSTSVYIRVHSPPHTPSIAFQHLPPNSARFSYATEGALFISAQLSTDEVSALRKVSVLPKLWKQPSALART